MKRTVQIFLLITLVFSFSQLSRGQSKQRQANKPQPETLTAEQIAQKFLPSIVLIVCDDGNGNFSQGSGFFIEAGKPIEVKFLGYEDQKGNPIKTSPKEQARLSQPIVVGRNESLILTNNHVIEGMVRGKAKIVVGGKAAREWWVKNVLLTDKNNDLALISVSEEKEVSALKLSASANATVGEKVYVLSNPEGLSGTISQGLVSGGIRKVKDIELLQIDAPISAGSSGGAVLNARGEVVGIATGSFEKGQNLNFAIPLSSIQGFMTAYKASSGEVQFARSTISNGWRRAVPKFVKTENPQGGQKEPPQQAQIPDTNGTPQSKPKDPIAMAQETLGDLLRGVEIADKNGKVRITNLSFSQCTMDLSYSEKLSSGGWEDSQTLDLAKLKTVDFGKNKAEWNAVFLELNERFLQKTTYDDGVTSASMRKAIVIPTANEKNAESAWLSFMVLKNKCAGTQSGAAEKKPSLKETTDWLTSKIEGSTFYTGQTFNQYERLRFTACDMMLTQVGKLGPSKLVTTTPADLKALQRVEIQRDKFGDWGVMLRFATDLNITFESYNLYVDKSSTKEDRLLIVFANDYERARRVGTAFIRLLELCSEERKESF